jgi:hypothetical protein
MIAAPVNPSIGDSGVDVSDSSRRNVKWRICIKKFGKKFE